MFPEEDVEDIEAFVGVDFGLTDICVTSDGVKSILLMGLTNTVNIGKKVRSSIQAKADTSKRSTKGIAGSCLNGFKAKKEPIQIVNHTIAKSIIISAKESGKGVAIED